MPVDISYNNHFFVHENNCLYSRDSTAFNSSLFPIVDRECTSQEACQKVSQFGASWSTPPATAAAAKIPRNFPSQKLHFSDWQKKFCNSWKQNMNTVFRWRLWKPCREPPSNFWWKVLRVFGWMAGQFRWKTWRSRKWPLNRKLFEKLWIIVMNTEVNTVEIKSSEYNEIFIFFLTVWKGKFWQFGKGDFDSLKREILTVWEGKFWQFEKENFDSLKKGNFDSFKRKILTVWKGKFWQFEKGNFDSLKRKILTVWKREILTV